MKLFDFLLGERKHAEKATVPQRQEVASPETAKQEVFEVAGVTYYLKNLDKVAEMNPEWRKTRKALLNAGRGATKIYRYKKTIKPVELIEEPTNPHDKNAVMVQIDGVKVGYIYADQTTHVKEILRSKAIESLSATITGGEYKTVVAEDKMIKNSVGPFVKVTVKYR